MTCLKLGRGSSDFISHRCFWSSSEIPLQSLTLILFLSARTQWVDKSNYLCGYFKLSLTYSLICTCRGQNIGKYIFSFFSFVISSRPITNLSKAHNLHLLESDLALRSVSGRSQVFKLFCLISSYSRSLKYLSFLLICVNFCKVSNFSDLCSSCSVTHSAIFP